MSRHARTTPCRARFNQHLNNGKTATDRATSRIVLTPRAIERQRAEHAASPEAGRAPAPEPEIPPLADGERRLLKVIDRPDGNQNRVYLIHRRPSDDADYQFVAVIQSSESTDFDFDTAWAWQGGTDARGVYIRVAEAYANTRTALCDYWLDPNVKWFADGRPMSSRTQLHH